MINAREPRALIGLMAGAALALAGAVTQGLLRNPLGDPGLLGVNAGAAATVVCFSFIPVLDGIPRFWTAFIGAGLSTLLFYFLSGGSRNTNPTRLVLTGAAINTCLFAGSCLLLISDIVARLLRCAWHLLILPFQIFALNKLNN